MQFSWNSLNIGDIFTSLFFEDFDGYWLIGSFMNTKLHFAKSPLPNSLSAFNKIYPMI